MPSSRTCSAWTEGAAEGPGAAGKGRDGVLKNRARCGFLIQLAAGWPSAEDGRRQGPARGKAVQVRKGESHGDAGDDQGERCRVGAKGSPSPPCQVRSSYIHSHDSVQPAIQIQGATRGCAGSGQKKSEWRLRVTLAKLFVGGIVPIVDRLNHHVVVQDYRMPCF